MSSEFFDYIKELVKIVNQRAICQTYTFFMKLSSVKGKKNKSNTLLVLCFISNQLPKRQRLSNRRVSYLIMEDQIIPIQAVSDDFIDC